MEKRNDTYVQTLPPEPEARILAGKTQREVAEPFGLKDKYVVKRLLGRQREKRRKLASGIVPRAKGRPRKAAQPRDLAAEQAYEIERLQMENKLLRDFLQCAGSR